MTHALMYRRFNLSICLAEYLEVQIREKSGDYKVTHKESSLLCCSGMITRKTKILNYVFNKTWYLVRGWTPREIKDNDILIAST
jgi:hypothetical protein